MTGSYLYALTTGGPGELDGGTAIDDSPPYLVRAHGLAAVVSAVRYETLAGIDGDDVREVAALARRHDAVVRAAFERAPVLPLRFGTVVSDDDAVRGLLADWSATVLTWLADLAGCREWGVRVTATAAEPDEPSSAKPASGREYLARRKAARDAADQRATERREVLDTAHRTLEGLARQAVLRPRSDAVLNGAYLVVESEEPAFVAQVERLGATARARGMEVAATGPWPPYSFAPAELAGAGR